MLAALTLPTTLDSALGPVILRRAVPDDLEALAALMSDDAISASRGDSGAADDLPRYARAIDAVLADASNDLLVATLDGVVVATLQLTLIPGLARRGATRLLVEAVRVSSALRSSGVGGAMMRWVTDVALPATASDLVQLTSDAARVDAHRFYTRLGFTDSHVGFKWYP